MVVRMKKSLIYFFYNIKILFRHKTNFILELANIIFNQLISLTFLYIIASTLPKLEGWSINELILVYGYLMLNKGVADLASSGLYDIEMLIRNGKLDTLLIRPMPVLKQILLSRIDFVHVVNISLGVGLVIYSFTVISAIHIFTILIISLLFLILSIIVIFSLRLISMSIAFWTQTSFPIAMSIENVSDFAKYPISIYNYPIEFILTFILPFAFLSYFPVSIILGKLHFAFVFKFIAIVPVICMISLFVWSKGLKRYESSGH